MFLTLKKICKKKKFVNYRKNVFSYQVEKEINFKHIYIGYITDLKKKFKLTYLLKISKFLHVRHELIF